MVSKVIVYRDDVCSIGRPREVTVDVRCDEILNTGYAAALVAVRTGTPLSGVQVVEIRDQ